TASTGNHGAATAWAAARTGLRAVVYVPERASRAKLDLLEQLGAELRHAGADHVEARAGVAEGVVQPADLVADLLVGDDPVRDVGHLPAQQVRGADDDAGGGRDAAEDDAHGV